ncbi:glutaredoxin-like protein [Russula decolorans]
MSFFPWLLDSLHPRKFRLRATLLCLFSLMSLTAYICLISPPALSFESRHHHPPHWRNLAAQFPLPPPGPPPRPDVLLSPEQELGALTAFMAALPQNVIPSNIDPSRPIDPQLVLDFDTRSPEAVDEIDDVVLGAWMNNPVVLFTKLRSAVTREVKTILRDLDLKPPPTIFDVDQRGPYLRLIFSPYSDADVITPLLFRLTNATELPILLIGGKPVGSMDTIRELNSTWTLRGLAIEAGALPDSSKKHRKGRR